MRLYGRWETGFINVRSRAQKGVPEQEYQEITRNNQECQEVRGPQAIQGERGLFLTVIHRYSGLISAYSLLF